MMVWGDDKMTRLGEMMRKYDDEEEDEDDDDEEEESEMMDVMSWGR